MALVVENGSGLPNAESYISVADTLAYATLMGLTWAPGTTALAEGALRRATVWLEARYRNRYIGYKVNRRNQALEWPRHDAYDRNDDYIPFTTIPVEVIKANAEAAIRELADPGSLSPDITTGEIEKRIKVEGIEIEYANVSGTISEQRPISTVIDDIMGNLLKESGTSRLSGKSARC